MAKPARLVPSHVLAPAVAERSRPPATIAAKDTVPHASFLGEAPSGDLLVIETPGYAEPPGRLLRRNGSTSEVQAVLDGVNAPAELSPSGRTLLAAGPLVDGEHASSVLIDLETWRIIRTLPLRCPFAWVDETNIVALAPPTATDPARVVHVDLATLTTRTLLPCRPLDPELAFVFSPARAILYTASRYSRVTAVRLVDGAVVWQRPPVRVVTQGMTYTVALDPVRNELLCVGLGDHDVLVLDATTGRELSRDNLGARLAAVGLPAHYAIGCAAVRADGLIVFGTDKGVVLERWPDGRWEAHKVAGRAIEACVLVQGGRALVVGGAEKNLRVVPYEG